MNISRLKTTVKDGFHLALTFLANASELEYENFSYLALVTAQHQKNTA